MTTNPEQAMSDWTAIYKASVWDAHHTHTFTVGWATDAGSAKLKLRDTAVADSPFGDLHGCGAHVSMSARPIAFDSDEL